MVTLPKCRYCERAFLPRTTWQDVCMEASCQAKRGADKTRAYRKRKAEADASRMGEKKEADPT